MQTLDDGFSFLNGPLRSDLPLKGFRINVSLIFLLLTLDFWIFCCWTVGDGSVGELGELATEWGGDTPGDNCVSVKSSNNLTCNKIYVTPLESLIRNLQCAPMKNTVYYIKLK